MKRNFLYVFVAFVLLQSCENKLDTQPDGAVMTDKQVKEVIEGDATKLASEVNGLFSIMKAFPAALGNSGNQDDYGFPSIVAKMEHNGQDCVGDVTGYNWYSGEQDYTTRNYTYRAPRLIWQFFYKQVYIANSIINKVDPATTDPVAKAYLGQALAMRAFDYFNLIQLFQFTYKGHEDALGVPIVKNDTPLDVINNNPRATVGDVYDFILSDLDGAITLLEGATRTNKSFIDQSIAYGLRARVNLVMQNWADAKSDATNALSVGGENPMSIADVSEPTFDDATAPGIMWGIVISSEDDCVKSGICNFTSMFTSLCFGYGGYTTIVGTWKKINILLYNQIPATDVRKGWWLDASYRSPLVNNYPMKKELYEYWTGRAYNATTQENLFWGYMGMKKYTNVKFAPNDKDYMSNENSSDFPLMRAEEMVLIQAEAEAMLGNTGSAKTMLENFVKTYRNPDYVTTAATSEQLQDEIWLQRRIEFWGEGISWFDIMRLKKPITRKADGVTGFSALAIFNIPSETSYMLWPIPIAEIQANNGISDELNNQMGTLPSSDPVKKIINDGFKIHPARTFFPGMKEYNNME